MKEVLELNIFMTSGTPEFMEKLRAKHAREQMVMLHGESTTVLLHETNGKTVFQTPRRFEVVASAGDFEENGYFVFHHIPVADEGRPVFEHRVKERANTLDAEPGFIAFRLLRPRDSDTYIFLTEWSGNQFYTMWKNASSFDHFLAAPTQTGANSTLHIFSGTPSITTYISKVKDDEA